MSAERIIQKETENLAPRDLILSLNAREDLLRRTFKGAGFSVNVTAFNSYSIVTLLHPSFTDTPEFKKFGKKNFIEYMGEKSGQPVLFLKNSF